MLTLVAEFDRREGWADAFDSCAEWLAWRTGRVAERALAAGLGEGADAEGDAEATPSGTRAERYQVTVHTEMATLEEDGEGGRSELDGVRVSVETSRRMACDASLVSMLHRGGKVVSVGRKTRTIPPHVRRALEERDRGCRYPGCGGRFTEAHHVRHWADGGETSLANTVLLCRRHHRLVHEGRVRMALDRAGQAVFFARRGGMLASAPPLPEPKLPLPPAPALAPGEMYNGAARSVDSAIPWEIEAAVREAVDAAGGTTAGRAAAGSAVEAVPAADPMSRGSRRGYARVSAANPGTPACPDGSPGQWDR